MSLRIESREGLPENGWAIVGEVLGQAKTEKILDVYPLDEVDEARHVAEVLQKHRENGMSWLAVPVSLLPGYEARSQATYAESSDLTLPELRQVA
ncbi:hypothetical protein HZB74_01770 [Candidatus Saccharibacteria bacterium]|nr:hypothetical protein [Candidatus Saccharibacteria bacterium]